MYNVEVERDSPYIEDLWYDFDDKSDARGFAEDVHNISGVKRVNLWQDGKLLQSWED